MASTGWRIGEATALMAMAIEDGPTMYVSMTHVNRKGEGVVPGGKSDAAERRIRMLPDCATMIRRRLANLSAPTDYVFTNSHSPTGLWEPSTFRNRWWKKSVAAAGLVDRKPTPHWLRHTHVMLCHAAGMSLPEIQRRLGHADIKTTINVYGRMIDDMPEDVAARLDVLLSGQVAPDVIEADAVDVRAIG
jgi:integrase